MNTAERYNSQKGKENRYSYRSGIDNYIASRLKIRSDLEQIQEQKEINKTIEKTIEEQINKSLKDILK